MTQRPDKDAVLARLRDFQRDTVDYVAGRMFDPASPAHRFLVADEVGLGKTYVARGLIAETIDRLWDEVDRIDIVYLCSNAQIAKQNLHRLNVLDRKPHDIADRLTLLPTTAHSMDKEKVNLLALTPGTSLSIGRAEGHQNERYVLYWALRRIWGPSLLSRNGAVDVLRGRVPTASFYARLGRRSPRMSPEVIEEFTRILNERPDLYEDFERLSDARRGSRADGPASIRERNLLVGRLRTALAEASIHSLQPDLLILDEFQRFSTVLDGQDDGARLANALFTYPGVRVLLLSATPYRMLTMRSDDPDGGDHFQDLLRICKFLLPEPARVAALEDDFIALRRGLAQGAPVAALAEIQHRIESTLRTVMTRTERLGSTADRAGMLTPAVTTLTPTAADIGAYVGMDSLAQRLNSPNILDYWKSSPYLLTFLDGYQMRTKLDRQMAAHEPQVAATLRAGATALDARAVSHYSAIDPGHPKVRALAADLDAADAYNMLWIPPSLPTTQLTGTYASPAARTFTKRLVFSAWAAVPRAVASLLSMEAERRLHGDRWKNYADRKSANLLALTGRGRSVQDMPVFGLLYPCPSLASLGCPRRYAATINTALPVDPTSLLDHVSNAIRERLTPYLEPAPTSGPVDQAWYWTIPLLLDDDPTWLADTLAYDGADGTDGDVPSSGSWLRRHAEFAADILGDLPGHLRTLGRPPDDLADVAALMAVSGPASMAWRTLDALVTRDDRREWSTTDDWASRDHAVRDASVTAARALRSLFSQPEAEAAVLASEADDTDYWRAVMSYALAGGLPAVLEENLHMLVESNGLAGKPFDEALFGDQDNYSLDVPDGLADAFAAQVLLRATPIRVKGMRAKGSTVNTKSIRIRHHFAARYGTDRLDEKAQQRATNVREAFNGPFWPFVLVSTSVGQEGLDFHPYSHAVVHWNLPHNPVDLEQREGRVHRYKGHAVRKNVAADFGDDPDVLTADDPWRTMFDKASAIAREQGHTDLVPYWVYPRAGGACIERHVPLLALSKDIQRYHDLVRTLGLYRLGFGQPRQEDLLALLESAYDPAELATLVDTLRVDLSPRPVRAAIRRPT
jgi:hypothetical protein